MNYKKKIQITSTGMVIASVYSSDGRRVGLKFFTSFFNSTEKTESNAIKAHSWADAHILMCVRQET